MAVIGCGYWGTKLLAALARLPDCRVEACCDLRAGALAEAAALVPGARGASDCAAMLAGGGLDAAVVATPAATHFELSKRCLDAGLDLLLEKPFVLCSDEALELDRTARQGDRVLAAGHTFMYSPQLDRLLELVRADRIGEPRVVLSVRTHAGMLKDDVDALWDLAPHDIYMASAILGKSPLGVTARGTQLGSIARADVAEMTLHYPGGSSAHVFVSRMDPERRRRLEVLGRRGKIVYDNVRLEHKLELTDGTVEYPSYGEGRPLDLECAHFLDCIRHRSRPRTDSTQGLEVVRVLEAATRSMASGGRFVPLEPAAPAAVVSAR